MLELNHKIQLEILKLTNSAKILSTELIQELWSGYGSLLRIKTNQQAIILKIISLPKQDNHPRGWNTNFSHQRKLKSYQVEQNWYSHYSKHIENAYTPRLLVKGNLESGESFLILEDLKEKGFNPTISLSRKQILLCLDWLAAFHRTYLKHSADHLWEIGTYWHLATRPDELESLEDLTLKDVAPKIDKILNNCPYKTIVHGDAKLDNFLFNENQAAAVDFQYVGGGVGVKDVAYFFSSIFNEKELDTNADEYLDYYFKALNHKEAEKHWRKLYPYAWCDFYRFLKGWSPGHYKINSYSERMKEQVLSWI